MVVISRSSRSLSRSLFVSLGALEVLSSFAGFSGLCRILGLSSDVSSGTFDVLGLGSSKIP